MNRLINPPLCPAAKLAIRLYNTQNYETTKTLSLDERSNTTDGSDRLRQVTCTTVHCARISCTPPPHSSVEEGPDQTHKFNNLRGRCYIM